MSNRLGDDRIRAARAVRQRLESLQRAGVTHLAKRKVGATPGGMAASAGGESSAAPPLRPKEAASDIVSAAAEVATKPAALEAIRQEVAACVRCPVLCGSRTQTVFGVGNPSAKICFFGEAPGADEDRLGEPFVGRAGQLLTKMIVACGLKREDVYILNVLKCRPPDNRNPLPDEVANCREYFERQLDIIRPEIICCLGAVASQALLQTDRTIGKLRKQFHDYRGTAVICTYHPAYLLRNPAAKGDAWEDLKMMMRRLGVEL